MEVIAVLAPLFGALIAGLLGKRIEDEGAQFITCALMTVAAIMSVLIFREVNFENMPRTVELFTWISSGELRVSWALRFDQLSSVMVMVVNVVSCLVHIYSVGYMHHDTCKARFMAYLSLFTFAMLMLVTSNNFAQLFFGWEGVGLASYLLIGFWSHKDSANKAAIKAFVVNRVGDFGLALGIMAIFFLFNTLDYDYVFEHARYIRGTYLDFLGYQIHGLSLIGALMFIGAMGKSAQLGLHTWLPDAMEGPTPVSALIHAATMVTAGVFLVARLSPIYEHTPMIRDVITVVGGLTALIAATIGMTQFDIKRVIAYSTMSQLGYMFFALGVSAYGAAIFHLFTHAFFKALLFLGAGSVIHAMSDEQDMRRMGGIWKMIPVTYAMMWIGSLALAGVPFFAGYFSKDIILEAAFGAQDYILQMVSPTKAIVVGTVHNPAAIFAFGCGILAAFMTAFYSWRLLFMTFHGTPRAEEKVMARVHESPLIMTIPLGILAVGAIAAGFVFHDFFVGEGRRFFWQDSLYLRHGYDAIEMAHHTPSWAKLLPTAVGVAGILIAYVFYMRWRSMPERIAARCRWLHNLFFNKWYFDELYDALIVRPAFIFGRKLWKTGDGAIIDGMGADAVAETVNTFASDAKKMQTGYVYHYAFAMLIGVVLAVAAYIYTQVRG